MNQLQKMSCYKIMTDNIASAKSMWCPTPTSLELVIETGNRPSVYQYGFEKKYPKHLLLDWIKIYEKLNYRGFEKDLDMEERMKNIIYIFNKGRDEFLC